MVTILHSFPDLVYVMLLTSAICRQASRLLDGRENTIELRAAYGATSLHSMFAILHGDLVGVLHLTLVFALHTISCISHDT